MRNKIVTPAEAVAVIQTGDALCTSGFVGIGVPDALLVALEKRFLETGAPRDLTLLFAAGQGDGKDRPKRQSGSAASSGIATGLRPWRSRDGWWLRG